MFVPNVAKQSVTDLLVTGFLAIGPLGTALSAIGPLETALSEIDPSETGLNDHELVHEVEGTVDEPAVKNHKVAEQADWAAGFFLDDVELKAAVALAL